MMNTISPPETPEIGRWQDLYRRALFETDKQKLPLRIAEAEQALRLRAKDLFWAGSDISGEEPQAVDDALYALQALRHCIEFRTSEFEVA